VWHHAHHRPNEITLHLNGDKWDTCIILTLEEQQELVKAMEEARKVAISNCSEITNGSDKENNND